ncbi:MAG: hypothetical protein Kow00109_15860 [Acidobacteriota bacterium]
MRRLSRLVGLVLCVFNLSSPLFAQELPQGLWKRFGGFHRLEELGRIRVRGTLAGERPAPFVLLVSGERSRFEVGRQVVLRRGRKAWHWGVRNRRVEREEIFGEAEIYVLPQVVLAAYGHRLRKGPGQGPWVRFGARLGRPEFLGYEPPPREVELQVDEAAGRLVEARFCDPGELGTEVVWRWEAYEQVGRHLVPRVVRREFPAGFATIFQVEAVDWQARFAEEVFSPEEGGKP